VYKKLLSKEQLAKVLGISVSRVEAQTLAGRIPCIRPWAGYKRYDLEDVISHFKENQFVHWKKRRKLEENKKTEENRNK